MRKERDNWKLPGLVDLNNPIVKKRKLEIIVSIVSLPSIVCVNYRTCTEMTYYSASVIFSKFNLIISDRGSSMDEIIFIVKMKSDLDLTVHGMENSRVTTKMKYGTPKHEQKKEKIKGYNRILGDLQK